MPAVFHERGFRFHFFANEGTPREPLHVHVARPGRDAKIWLDPVARVAQNRGLTPAELRWAVDTVIRRRQEIADAWNAFFAGTD